MADCNMQQMFYSGKYEFLREQKTETFAKNEKKLLKYL